jgi:RNA polymerase sigma-70 factor (ECF subfamily)
MDLRARAGEHAEARANMLELLDLALGQLDPRLVEVFVLCQVEGLSAPEISESLRIPAGTVASRLRRARQRFGRPLDGSSSR